MAPESQSSVHLRDYIERILCERDSRWRDVRDAEKTANNERFAAMEKATIAALASADKAVLKSETSADKRADASNEIRQAMIDQQKTLANKNEVDAALVSAERRLTVLEEIASRTAGKSSGAAMTGELGFKLIAALASVAAVAAAVFAFLR